MFGIGFVTGLIIGMPLGGILLWLVLNAVFGPKL